MTQQDPRQAIWERECRIFGRYLLDQEPTAYLRRKYIQYHLRQVESDPVTSRLDLLLLRVACAHTWGTHLADAYATQFSRDATLRRKLVLVLALAECAPPGYEVIDSTFGSNRLLIGLRMGWYAMSTGLMLGLAMAIFGSASVFFRLVGDDCTDRTR